MRRRPRTGLLLAIPLLLLSACDGYEVEVPPPPPRAEVEWRVEAVLGDDADGDPAGLLGQPAGVRTDDDRGLVYVGDRAAGAIKVYDTTGTYLRSIGRRGREPGELVDITCFEVLSGGDLLVADGLSLRLSRFTSGGELVDTWDVDPIAMLWPREVRQLEGGRLLFAYKMPTHDRDGTSRPDAGKLLHLYDAGLEAKLDAFAGAVRLAPPGRTADLLLQQKPGSLWVEEDGSVLFAPGLYSAKIHRFREAAGGWRGDGALRGYISTPEAFLEASIEAPRLEAPSFDIRSRRGRVTGYHRNESRGLFRLAGGRLVHFTLVAETLAEGEGRTFGVELFDDEDRLRAFGPLERVAARSGEPTALATHVEWKDSGDRFYLRQRRGGHTVVTVAHLHESGVSP